MASSGTFIGSRTVSSGPQLELYWRQLSQDIPNNRTRIRLELRVYSQYNIYFSATKSGQLYGTNFSYSGGMNGAGRKTVYTKDIWVNHNSDGSKSINFSGHLDIKVSWSTGYVSRISVSGTAHLNTIPRASSLDSFSIGYALQPNNGNQVNLRISRHSSSFRHNIYLKHGSTTIASWGGQGLPTSLSISSSQVNMLMSRMSSKSTDTVTLVVQTKSGSTNIGSSVSRNATASIHSSVIPTVSNFSFGIAGTGHDKDKSIYVQRITKAKGSYSAVANGGAKLVSERIYVRKTDKTNTMVIEDKSGETGVITGSGSYEAIAEVKDSRGRYANITKTFTVQSYSPPKVTEFTATRISGTPTKVSVKRYGEYSSLEGENEITITVYNRKVSEDNWTELYTDVATTGTFGTTYTAEEIDETSSYEFRVVAKDQFKNKAEAIVTVSTDKVVLSINKNDGVGIGKIHEKGVLDVEGQSYFSGHARFMKNLYTDGLAEFNGITYFNGDFYGKRIHVDSVSPIGTDRSASAPLDDYLGGITLSQSSEDGYPDDYTMQATFIHGPYRNMQMSWSSTENQLYVRGWRNNRGWSDWSGASFISGSNSNGEWIRYSDGTQICYKKMSLNLDTGRYSEHIWVFPASFSSSPNVFATRDGYSAGQNHNGATFGVYDEADRVKIRYFTGEVGRDISGNRGIRVMAIGRWK